MRTCKSEIANLVPTQIPTNLLQSSGLLEQYNDTCYQLHMEMKLSFFLFEKQSIRRSHLTGEEPKYNSRLFPLQVHFILFVFRFKHLLHKAKSRNATVGCGGVREWLWERKIQA